MRHHVQKPTVEQLTPIRIVAGNKSGKRTDAVFAVTGLDGTIITPQKELMQLLQETQKQYKDNDPDEKVNELFKGDRRLMKNR